MGVLAGLRLASGIAGSNVLPFPRQAGAGVVSPWADTSHLLPALVAEQLLGLGSPLLVTREMAMRVPAIVKARALLHSVIGTRPLRAYRGGQVLPVQPTWLYRSDTGIAPRMRTKLILDDLLFCEASLLAVQRGTEGQVVDAVHVPYDRWSVGQDGVILVDGAEVGPDQVVWIPGPGPGLLAMGAELIAGALSTDRAWIQRVRNPFPAMVLQHTEDVQLSPDEAREFVQTVAAARRNPDSAVMYVPFGIEVASHAADATDLYESGRNALRLDFGNLLNIPSALLDGSVSEASLTYSTQEGRRNDFVDLTVPYWSTPIEDALSLDNVVPRGQYVRFDFADLLTPTASPAGAPVED